MTSESDTPPGPPTGEDNKQPRRRRGRRGGRGRRRPAGPGTAPNETAMEEGGSTPKPGMEDAAEYPGEPEESESNVSDSIEPEAESIAPAAGNPPEPPRRNVPRERERRDRDPAPQQRVERRPEVERQNQPWEPPPGFRPASKGSIQGAIEEALHAIEAMRAALSDLEEIAELLEEVEVQQRADEREIDRLRSTIRSFQSQRGRDRDPRDSRDPRDRDPRDREPGDRDPRGRESREARPSQETVFRAEEPARSEEESGGQSGPDES